MNLKVVLVSGGFDPLHSGHIEYFKKARALGDHLIVGINSDAWLGRKKGRSFMPVQERASIVKELSCVDNICIFTDEYDADGSCKKFVEDMCEEYKTDDVIFANGGDRTSGNIPEMEVESSNLSFQFGVGGEDKKNSSSWILKEWKNPKVNRKWGTYTVLDTNGYWRVKELSIDVGKSLSDQRHFIRSEHWHIVSGELKMQLEFPNEYKTSKIYKRGDSIDIPVRTWHKATNVGSVPVKVIEVWQGNELSEEDIERRLL
jgi:D-beta-D-heptose 7-phosphate kinase/D-beta-D-heptose 1-phosphate adenosyltransferase